MTHRVSRDEGGVLRSPAPALVVATPVKVGDEVAAGAPVLVLESMKMETVLPAPFAARVKELHVAAGSQVETGAALARLEPTGGAVEAAGAAAADAPDLDLPADVANGDVAKRAVRARADLSAMLLGYDLDPGHETRTLAGYLAARDELAASGASPVTDEMDLLTVFADFAELSRNRPVGEEAHIENRVHSPREHFHTYLQTLDPERGAPARRLRRAARAGARPLRRHRCRAHRGARGGGVPGVPGPAALGPRGVDGDLDPAALAGRARSGGAVPGGGSRAARPAGVGHPAALSHRRRPGAQRALPLVRPAAGRLRPRLGARVGG